jgi:hypothetical protein
MDEFLNDRTVLISCLILSSFRVYLEIIKFDFNSLPISSKFPNDIANRFHKTGLYLSIGMILLFTPQVLFY